MIIGKVMNNNCIQASIDEQEVIISGPGVSYNEKYGMSVPKYPVNRIFYVRNKQKNKLYRLIEYIDIEYVFAAEKIVQYAKKNPEEDFNPSLLLIPADRISSAISRVASGIQINSVLLGEIKVLYRAECIISRDALTTINEQSSVQPPDDKIGFIALYTSNNYENSVNCESVRIIELSQIITELIGVIYNRKVDRSSLNYSGFMMHLKYLSSRMLRNGKIEQKDIGDTYEQFLEKDILLQHAVREIERYLHATLEYELTLEEKLYSPIRTKVLTS